ncbi:hypothetical protein SAMN05444006_109178 [Allgaiera indica]|uniref:YHS domain-containing protein n=1 Tax=Allgaiera indica TaxID=765699 RepID=A0A1H2YRW8_9RHOB|nr:hypothetical protein SAMN05444006_109178 [Allgaiera indica]
MLLDLTPPMDPTRRSFLALSALAPLPWFLPGTASAQSASAVCLLGGLAIGGHDPVAYFTQGRPVQGRNENALMWRGAMWLFSTEESMDHFTRMPRRFAPRYGGYCAMSMAEGKVVDGDPGIWEIDDGRLYLLSSPADHKIWDSDVPGYVAEADEHWPSILNT